MLERGVEAEGPDWRPLPLRSRLEQGFKAQSWGQPAWPQIHLLYLHTVCLWASYTTPLSLDLLVWKAGIRTAPVSQSLVEVKRVRMCEAGRQSRQERAKGAVTITAGVAMGGMRSLPSPQPGPAPPRQGPTTWEPAPGGLRMVRSDVGPVRLPAGLCALSTGPGEERGWEKVGG